MLSTQVHTIHTSRQAAQLGKVAAISLVRTVSSTSSSSLLGCPAGLRLGASQRSNQARLFSTTQATQLRDFFPVKETAHIQTTPPAWPHHGYTYEEMNSVEPAHRPPRGFGDTAAWKIVRFARYCMDKATGMDKAQQVDKKNPTTAIAASKPLTESQWVSFPCHNFSPFRRGDEHVCGLTRLSLFDSSSSKASLACQEWWAACSVTSRASDE